MSSDTSQSAALRVLVGLAAFVVVIAGARAAQSIIVPFLLAGFLAIISAPYLNWLQRRGVPQVVALVLVIAAILATGFVLAALVGTSVDDFTETLPYYQERLQTEVAGFVAWLHGKGVDVSDRTFLNYVDPASAMRLASALLRGLGNVLTNAFLIVLTVIFILMEASSFPGKLRAALGTPEHPLEQSRTVLDNIKRYMTIKMMTSALTGIVVALGLAAMGVDFPLLWGFFAFLLNFIPNVGSFIAALPAILIAQLELGLFWALMTTMLYLAVNIIVGSILEPRWMGDRLGVSPLIVFLSLVFWGWVFGPVGMFLSVPLTISIQIALASHEDSRWVAILLGPNPESGRK
ncbi:MAG TPA: AI-2E family transporter [Gammaproteobacteria bacterium]|nr:AI-2E family transporter [Gammaproteobacteria bacterium]